jgi:hypothetical protein
LHNVELMGATPTIYARSRDRWRAYTSNNFNALSVTRTPYGVVSSFDGPTTVGFVNAIAFDCNLRWVELIESMKQEEIHATEVFQGTTERPRSFIESCWVGHSPRHWILGFVTRQSRYQPAKKTY